MEGQNLSKCVTVVAKRGSRPSRESSKNGGGMGAEKSYKSVQNRFWSGPGSIVSGPGGDFGGCRKLIHFDYGPVGPKSIKIVFFR